MATPAYKAYKFPFLGETWVLGLVPHKMMQDIWHEKADDTTRALYPTDEVAGLTFEDTQGVFIIDNMNLLDTVNTVCHELYHVACSQRYDSYDEETKAWEVGAVCAFLLDEMGLLRCPDPSQAP